MKASEYEYAEVHGHASIGPIVQFWSTQGWDVVTASYGINGSSHALLRRPRGVGLPDPPETRIEMIDALGSRVVVENNDSGHWGATRYCTCGCGRKVAHVYWYDSKGEAVDALDKQRAPSEVAALAREGKQKKAFEVLRSSLGLSWTGAEWLMHEVDPAFQPEFNL